MAANLEIAAGLSSPEAGAERVWWANEMMMVDDSKEGGFKKAEFKFYFVETRRMSPSEEAVSVLIACSVISHMITFFAW